MEIPEVRVTFRALRALSICHPDEASNASGRKGLGQLRLAKPVPVSEIAQRPFSVAPEIDILSSPTPIHLRG